MKSSAPSRSPAPASNIDEKEPYPKLAWEHYSVCERPDCSRLPSRSWKGYIWSFIPSIRRRTSLDYDYHVALTDDDDLSNKSVNRRAGRSTWLQWTRRALLLSPIAILSLFGALHIILVLCSHQNPFSSDLTQHYLDSPSWTSFVDSRKPQLTYPTDVTRDVVPIPCHSHNDYWRNVPLFDALRWGCTSVEADVWLFENEDELLIGHNTASLTRNRTLRNLYIDPLVDLLDRMNPETDLGSSKVNSQPHGVFDTDSTQTLVLLIDFKTDGAKLFPAVLNQLEPLRNRNYLTHWNGKTVVPGPITVVGTGNAPFDLIAFNPHHREIFFDAPLDKFYEPPSGSSSSNNVHPRSPAQGNTGTSSVTSPDDFNSTNSHYASVPFLSSIGLPWTGQLSSAQLENIRGQIRGAKRRGLKARYWDTPAWPTSLRNYVWEVLVREGADVLNVDDLEAAAKWDWRVAVPHGWFDG